MNANDEIKAAAERRRAYLATCKNQTILTEANPYIGSGWRIEIDCIALADWAVQELAARAEKEAEEGKPVDEAWLRETYSAGLYANTRTLAAVHCRNRTTAYEIACEVGGSFTVVAYDANDGDKVVIAKITTRGQLLRLLEALGKEGA